MVCCEELVCSLELDMECVFGLVLAFSVCEVIHGVMWRVILTVVCLFRVLVGLSLPSFLYKDLCETSSKFGVC